MLHPRDAWANQPFLTVQETAVLFGRSTTWVHGRLAALDLIAVPVDNDRRVRIATQSVKSLLRARKPKLRLVVVNASISEPNISGSQKPNLYLVIDNTK